MIPPSATQWCISLLGASSGVTDIRRRHTVPAGMKCCGSLEISIKITKMHDVHLPRTPAEATMSRSFTLWLRCSYVPAYLLARLPLNSAPDWAKTGLTWRSALRADDWEVGRKWLRGPDELRQMFDERKGAGTSRWSLAPLCAGGPKHWSQPLFSLVRRLHRNK